MRKSEKFYMKKNDSTDAEHPLFAFQDNYISFQVRIIAKNVCKKSFAYFAPEDAPTT